MVCNRSHQASGQSRRQTPHPPPPPYRTLTLGSEVKADLPEAQPGQPGLGGAAL